MNLSAPRARLPFPYRPETEVVAQALQGLQGRLDWPAVVQAATPWVRAVREQPAPFWAMESLLREYPISSAEGLALMRLAEALLRVPDAETAIALTADQLGRADFDSATGEGPHRMLASLSASAIALSKKFLPEEEGRMGLIQRLGAQTVVAATVRARPSAKAVVVRVHPSDVQVTDGIGRSSSRRLWVMFTSAQVTSRPLSSTNGSIDGPPRRSSMAPSSLIRPLSPPPSTPTRVQ